jgi:hypothetical protein
LECGDEKPVKASLKKPKALSKEPPRPKIAGKQNHNAEGKGQTPLQHKAVIIMINVGRSSCFHIKLVKIGYCPTHKQT